MARWKLGQITESSEYFLLTYQRISDPSTKAIEVAKVSKSNNDVFIVELLIELASNKMKKIWAAVVEELDFYIIEKKEHDIWGYLIYHSGTSSNLYSEIHWIFFRNAIT